MCRLGRLPLPLELGATAVLKRAGNVYGRSWFPGTGEHRRSEGAEESGGMLVLLAAYPVGEVARGDDQFRKDTPNEGGQSLLDLQILTCTRMKI